MSELSGDSREKNCIWICPSCGNTLEAHESGFKCIDGHSYDRARQGYVNLLLANQKRSRDPGDGAAMVEARRNFLSAGHYSFLFDEIADCLRKQELAAEFRLLDLGCGEGSYLHALRCQFPKAHFWGSDISKFAIKRAANYVEDAQFCVASNYHLPFQDRSVDVLLSVFSPIDLGEIKRVLKPAGVFIRVLPGEKHFWQLKQALYKNAQEHEEPLALTGANLLSTVKVNSSQVLTPEALKNLVGMTPLNWRGDMESKNDLFTLPSFELNFDFIMQGYSFDGV